MCFDNEFYQNALRRMLDILPKMTIFAPII